MTFDRDRPQSLRDSRWRDDAACTGLDPDVFFPVDDGKSRLSAVQAKRVCQLCPVRDPCLSWATSASVDYGVWGGLTGPERRALRSRGPRRRSPHR